ncbi:NAD-dependent protein deacylase [Oceanirhabdus sp. W0125-5]|uniref:NAD-dependent protein deacylase n=1 Tax=Oceanirhabdus sp. W0125-5 TaxID=2999116 RepID=UPI0022F2CA8E|nr:NAD-dependent protein deacylase [Oceanirhabdus sp. W0125-5]WBW95121.1 NAD-dependent protein deacylase [Oceanirhabdus sp. W0125-5]
MDLLTELFNLLKNSKKGILIITGAGVSVKSGIKQFRGEEGLYKNKFKGYNPETLLDINTFWTKNKLCREFINEFIINNQVYKPNIIHDYIQQMESFFKINGLITQNIDGLHQRAGSSKVIELHGNLREFYCQKCGERYTKEEYLKNQYCYKCESNHDFEYPNNFIRPNIVFYGEWIDENLINEADEIFYKSDVIVVIGSSLEVSTISNYVNTLRDQKLIIINKDETYYDHAADLVIHGDASEILKALLCLK